MTLVVDASIVLKLYLDEAGSAEAEALLSRPLLFAAPELLLAEVGNAAWKAVRRGGMTRDQARDALRELSNGPIVLTPLAELAAAATDLALRRDHPVYDCFYVALAQREGAPLVTADARLASAFGSDAEIRLLYPSASA
ncbi:type II toxin-antitoxin system VapC family toxin [Paracraurococcus lichenis]|uniref:Ribonuclease VapC n=1 Tax=Paracraurococcus lichenis TaxID=3064888 RepID=A0ABT9DSZ9_9PROT|nr:type II toxin-antitoxin system VapC family toxin [Paracraurococcus sp. LOR1-02]MDO9707008.1 type II toxin-antitoxin system VapC family toxin [Paracraurococcus sp. LOR1-02]